MLTLNMREELRDMLGEPRMVCFHFSSLIPGLTQGSVKTNFGIVTSQLQNEPSDDLHAPSSTCETRSSPKPQKSTVQMSPSLTFVSSSKGESMSRHTII